MIQNLSDLVVQIHLELLIRQIWRKYEPPAGFDEVPVQTTYAMLVRVRFLALSVSDDFHDLEGP